MINRHLTARLAPLVVALGVIVPVGFAAATTAPPADTAPSDTASTSGSDTGTAAADTGANPSGCVDDWQGEPLFADQFKVQFADNYTLEYFDNYKVLTVVATGPGGPSESYVLLQCGTEAPELTGDLASAPVVEIPVQSLYSASSSHLGFLDALGLADLVTGFGQPDAVVIPSVRQRIDAGEVVGFAPNFETDAEAVLAGDPDVFVTGGFEDPAFEALRAGDIPVVANAEWLETSPKGWAEWVGFFGALTNTEAEASALLETWASEYDDAAALAADAATRPSVIDGSLFEGTWYATGGAGIRATFIADAGGDYVYADDTTTGTIELDIETILTDGTDADVWVGVSDFFANRTEAVTTDERYGNFAAWDGLGVFTTAFGPDAAVSFAESGPTMIGPYLLDYVKAFHPDLAADHEFVFLSQLPAD